MESTTQSDTAVVGSTTRSDTRVKGIEGCTEVRGVIVLATGDEGATAELLGNGGETDLVRIGIASVTPRTCDSVECRRRTTGPGGGEDTAAGNWTLSPWRRDGSERVPGR